MYAANVWSFDPFQPVRIYRFRLKSTGETIRGKYVRETTKGKLIPDQDREYEFMVDGNARVFKAAEIVDALFVGI
ncbi:hypothetical protein L0244_16050 [bacterium]|nr:hypothetical protein [bacterium]MCI0614500.1 hypothetical protein [bacterium]